MNTNTTSWGKSKLVLLGSVLFLSSFFFGGQAKADTCTWNGSVSESISNVNNWNEGGNCPAAQGGRILRFNTSTNPATFDMNLNIGNIIITSNYQSTITVNDGTMVTTTGDLTISSNGLFSAEPNTKFNVGGNLSVGVSSTVSFGAGSFNSAVTGNVNVTGTLNLAGGNLSIGGILNLTSGTLSAGATTISLSSSSVPFVNSGTFNAGTGMVEYNGDGAHIATNTTYYKLDLYNGSKSLDGNIQVGGNYFFLNSGTLTQSTGTVTMVGNGFFGGANGTNFTLYNLTLSSTTHQMYSNVTTTNVLTLNSILNGNYTMNLTGTGTPFINNGSISEGTIKYSGATANVAATTYINLTINGIDTLVGNVTTTNVLTINNGKTLVVGGNTLVLSGDGTSLVNNGTFTANTSTVLYSGSAVNVASTTYYNLSLNNSITATLTGSTTVQNILLISNGVFLEPGNDYLTLSATGTPLSNLSAAHLATSSLRMNVAFNGNGVNIPSAVYYNLFINSASSSLIGNVTSTNALIIGSGKTLNAGSYTIVLNADSTSVFQNSGTFNAGSSNVYYANTGSATVGAATYYTLTLGTGTYVLDGHTTSTNAFVNGGSLTLSSYNLIASGTYTNNGTVTGISYAKKQATGAGLNSSSYTSGSSNGAGNSVTITVYDPTANSNGATAQTITVTLAASNYSDSETVTLTEDGVASGNFVGTIPFYITNSNSTASNRLDVSGNGTLTLTNYSNGYGDASLSTLSASYSGSTYSSGGGVSGGGSAPSVSSAVSAATVSAGGQTTSQTITLNLSATNATQVAISEDPGFAGASWDTYAPTKPFTLSKGAGEKTIYVKFRSAAGGVTNAYKVNVTLKADYVAAPTATTAPAAVITAVSQFEVSNPESKVVIAPVKTLVYKPNSTLKYTYSYKNESTKTAKVKVVRQVVDAKGKVVAKATGSVSIAKGKTFKTNVTNVLNSKLVDGVYTVKVQIVDFKTGAVLEENSFDITVKKPAPVVKKPVVKAPVIKKK